eukprot:NODE_260_length_12610_cov_0.413076.p12 type:complete len:101 gc:universal NODE_260_length_12610_cov_0.413076:2676-2978(+)
MLDDVSMNVQKVLVPLSKTLIAESMKWKCELTSYGLVGAQSKDTLSKTNTTLLFSSTRILFNLSANLSFVLSDLKFMFFLSIIDFQYRSLSGLASVIILL